MVAYQRSRTTKIVATIGPASWNPQTLTQLIAAGVDVARINAAHDDIATRAHLVGV
ncbi:MAG: pyruvate kinase, partial [Thermomicrobiaceae bacterium]|nr:pyruvate kinase [Thermomicrobiaceae bacterium]